SVAPGAMKVQGTQEDRPVGYRLVQSQALGSVEVSQRGVRESVSRNPCSLRIGACLSAQLLLERGKGANSVQIEVVEHLAAHGEMHVTFVESRGEQGTGKMQVFGLPVRAVSGLVFRSDEADAIAARDQGLGPGTGRISGKDAGTGNEHAALV